MNSTEAIDTVLHDYDGVAANDGSNTDRRTILLGFLQHIYSYTHNFRPWSWTYIFEESAFTLEDGDKAADLPERFMEFGRHGGLFHQGTKAKWREESMALLTSLRMNNTGNNQHQVFALFSNALQFTFAPDVNIDFDAMYRLMPQILEDDDDEVWEIPQQYAHTVILPGFRFLAQQSKSDVVAGEYGGQYKDGLQQMLVTENRRKTAAQLMPLSRRNW